MVTEARSPQMQTVQLLHVRCLKQTQWAQNSSLGNLQYLYTKNPDLTKIGISKCPNTVKIGGKLGLGAET